MLTKRIIPCLDVIKGRVTKGVKFKDNIDLGDPVEMSIRYSDGGADELVFYDITASAEGRALFTEYGKSDSRRCREGVGEFARGAESVHHCRGGEGVRIAVHCVGNGSGEEREMSVGLRDHDPRLPRFHRDGCGRMGEARG